MHFVVPPRLQSAPKKRQSIVASMAQRDTAFSVMIPPTASVYEYKFVSQSGGKWELWTETLKDLAAIPKVRC